MIILGQFFWSVGKSGTPPPPVNPMPDVGGLIVWQAIAVLIEADIVPNIGLVPYSPSIAPPVGYLSEWPCIIVWERSSTVRPDFVISQDPPAGTPGVTFETQVTLTVAQFPFGVADRYTAGGYT